MKMLYPSFSVFFLLSLLSTSKVFFALAQDDVLNWSRSDPTTVEFHLLNPLLEDSEGSGSNMTPVVGFHLRLRYPTGLTENFQLPPSDRPSINLQDLEVWKKHGDTMTLPEGIYRWEIRSLREPRKREVDETGGSPASTDNFYSSGSFRVMAGEIVDPNVSEESSARRLLANTNEQSDNLRKSFKPHQTPALHHHRHLQNQVFATDLIVKGSTCTGVECVDSEFFGSDALRIKEDGIRMHFEDTSTLPNFPGNDWRLTANDLQNGGESYFSIDDATAGRTLFRVDAGGQANTLFADRFGRVGIGTNQPVQELHAVTGDTPTLRLEQDASAGSPSQTWDVGANEANFFIRDATDGSRLPFRIQPRAPSNSIFVNANGNVGFGTSNPDTNLHVRQTSGTDPVSIRLDVETQEWELKLDPASKNLQVGDATANDIAVEIETSTTGSIGLNRDTNIFGDLVVSGDCNCGSQANTFTDLTFNPDTNELTLVIGGVSRTVNLTMTTPSSAPTPGNAPPPSPSGCFSSVSVVEGQEKGLIPVSQIEVGDFVKISGGNFAEVYSLAHVDQSAATDFLQIWTSGSTDPLEVTPDHLLIFCNDSRCSQTRFLSSGRATVGDRLLSETGVAVDIVGLGKVRREGLYAPFTAEGKIVVNNIVASTYSVIYDQDDSVLPISFHWIAHATTAYRRMYCKVNINWCKEESHNSDGLATWIPSGYKWFAAQHKALLNMSLITSLPALFLMYAVEAVVSAYVRISKLTIIVSGVSMAMMLYLCFSKKKMSI